MNRPFHIRDLFTMYSIKFILKYIINYKGFRFFLPKEIKRRDNYWEFNNKYIVFKGLKSDYLKIVNQVDCFVFGSDQVWNPNFIKYRGTDKIDPFWLGKGMNKKISYSASFGISQIPETYVDIYKKSLKEFLAISVREQAGCKIIESLINVTPHLNLDPTLLLSKEDWIQIESKPQWYNSTNNYVVTYFLGNLNQKINELLSIISTKDNLEVINIYDINNENWYSINPSEFIFLIRNAKLVLTDSFHATVFSILFNIPFITFDRIEEEFEGMKNMNSRIDTLLKIFNLECRHCKDGIVMNNIYNIDFSNIEHIRCNYRKDAINYLVQSLQNI